jgi:hypothetical protein
MFKAVCKGWNYARSGEAHTFDPWILNSEFISESRAVTFASIADMQHFEVSFPALAEKRTTLIGCRGSGSLVALDCIDWCNELMMNSLSPRKHIRLPQLPKWSQMATLQACILCLETTAGAESFVLITFFWLEKSFAALGSLPFLFGIWVANPTRLHYLRKISGAVLLNTCKSTWGMIFQHLPILVDFGRHGC